MAAFFPQYVNKMFVAGSGINFSEIEPHEFFLKKIENSKSKTKINFITVASFIKRKNIDITLDALKPLSDFDWEYTIIGDGDEKDFLTSKIDSLKLNEKVHLLGKKTRDEVLTYLKSSDVFIMVSSSETFGLVYLEAMAKGNMIIGCKNWGIDGVVVNGYNGYLVEERNCSQLTNVLQNLFLMPFTEKQNILLNTEKTILANTNESTAENYLQNILK
jgi:glycosyltransferase involved in cell wall biosynthesis